MYCLRNRFVIIVNLAPSRGKEVGHFVVIAGKPNAVFYFDSYGHPPSDKNIISFLQHCMRKVLVCHKPIQSYDSAYCPLYAMFMALYLDWYPWNKDTKKFPVYFNFKNPKENDKLIAGHVRELLDKITNRWGDEKIEKKRKKRRN